jgi:hypothetical protein
VRTAWIIRATPLHSFKHEKKQRDWKDVKTIGTKKKLGRNERERDILFLGRGRASYF